MCVELWDTVYSRPGVITLCNAAGFDTAVVGQHLVIEHAGAHVRNFEYGYRSCFAGSGLRVWGLGFRGF